jgi:hypothetical protein
MILIAVLSVSTWALTEYEDDIINMMHILKALCKADAGAKDL